jgi:hypothetical protein
VKKDEESKKRLLLPWVLVGVLTGALLGLLPFLEGISFRDNNEVENLKEKILKEKITRLEQDLEKVNELNEILLRVRDKCNDACLATRAMIEGCKLKNMDSFEQRISEILEIKAEKTWWERKAEAQEKQRKEKKDGLHQK